MELDSVPAEKKNELHIKLCDTMKNMGQIPNWLGKKPISVN